MKEVVFSSEAPVNYHITFWYHIPEDRTLQSYRRENLWPNLLIDISNYRRNRSDPLHCMEQNSWEENTTDNRLAS
jgi:hypothetical protein